MNRRHFLSLLGLAAATAAVDPERLLWTPGATTHVLPPAGGWREPWGTPAYFARLNRQYLDGAIGREPGLAFHPDAFALVSEPLAPPPGVEYWYRPHTSIDVSVAAKALADHVDQKAVLYAYGEQLPPDVARTYDAVDKETGISIRFIQQYDARVDLMVNQVIYAGRIKG